MKKAMLFIVLGLLSYGAFAQERIIENGGNNLIKLNFDGLFLDRYQVSYERVVGKYTSVQLTAGILFDYFKEESEGSPVKRLNQTNGFLISPEFRVYLSDFTNEKVPEGAYFAALGRLEQSTLKEEYSDGFSNRELLEDEMNVGLGVAVGFQYITDFGLGFDVFVGPEFRYQFLDRTNTQVDTQFPEFDNNSSISTVEKIAVPFAGLNLSYQF